jgi:crossover junction endodeoxyribonuclease RuvC
MSVHPGPRSPHMGGLGSSPGVGHRRPVQPKADPIVATPRLDPPLRPARVLSKTESLSVVLGLDAILTNTGLICLDLQGNLVTSWNIKPKKDLSGVDRLVYIQHQLVEFLEGVMYQWLVAHVCMEQYGFAGLHGQHAYIGEGGGAVKLQLLESLGDPVGYPTLVAPNQLKKFVSGKGTSKKEGMLLFVYKKWGYETRDNNLADAYGLARIALSLHLDTTTSNYEREVIDALHPHTESAPWHTVSTPYPNKSTPASQSTSSSKSGTTRPASSS